jgi:hypothetical protein
MARATFCASIVGSMNHVEALILARDELRHLGHAPFITNLAAPFVGKTEEEKERIKIDQKVNHNAIREFWNLMQGADAILVMNLDCHGIKYYIGGNVLMEIGFAHVLNQAIYLYNPIPDIPYYKSEIEAVCPIIINPDFHFLSALSVW